MNTFPRTLSELEAEVSTEPKCQGKTYKCKISTYVDSKGNFTTKTVMVQQRRASCRCGKCEWEQDDIHETTACQKPPYITDPEDGALYRLRMTNVGTDWETGYVDEYDLEFVKLKE